MDVVKYKHNLLDHGTLKSTLFQEWMYELQWFFA